jgi:hypothetical protein
VSEPQAEISLDVWLYGALARYGGEAAQPSFAHLALRMPAGSTMAELLARLAMPTEARGITFIGGNLSAMPGLQPDLGHVFQDGDRVGIFDPKSMWPFQYRHGAAMIDEMKSALSERDDGGLKSRYDRPES